MNAFADIQFGRHHAYTSEIAQANNGIFAINAIYYGFAHGIIIRQRYHLRDIPAHRSGFLSGWFEKIYDETQTSAEELLADGVWNTLSFGPALLEDYQVVENIDQVEVDTNFGNHPIQGNQPRTGIGIIDENHFVFIVVDGRSKGYSMGVTLTEFAEMFKALGCSDAYNLDGGGSSTMYFMGRGRQQPAGKE
jgi:exopolysaccharide biosynthesis protein